MVEGREHITAASAAYLNQALERTGHSGHRVVGVEWYLWPAAHRQR